MLGWAAGIPRVAWVLFAALPLLQLTVSATGPVIPEVREAFELSYVAVGAFVASLSVTRLICGLPAGQLAVRYNGRSLICASAGATVIACLVGGLAVDYWQLLLARALLGATSAINQGVILAWLVGLAGARNRGRLMGLSDAGFSMMVVFVPPLSGVLATALSWRAPFALGALAAIAAGVLVWVGTRPEQADAALRGASAAAAGDALDVPGPADSAVPASAAGGALEAPGPAESAMPAPAEAAERPSFGRLLPLGGPVLLAAYVLTFTVFFARNALLNAYLPLLGGVALGLPPPALGVAIGALSLLSVGVVVAGGVLVDRFGRRAVLLPGLGLLLLAQGALLLVRDVETFYVVVLFQAVSFLLNALPPSLVGEALPRAYGGLGIAGYRLVADSAILTAPLVMGLTLDYTGYTFPVLLLLAETLLGAIVATVALRRGLPARVLAQG